MTSKDALELLNMFTVATQIAKSKNKVECKFEITETALSNLLKEAFPKLKNANQLAKSILSETYPFTAPSFSPEMKYFCIARKNIIIGMVEIIEPAAI